MNTDLGFGSRGVFAQESNGEFTSPVTDPWSHEIQVTPVIAPTVLGAGFAKHLLWDSAVDDKFRDPSGVVYAGFDENAALENLAVGPVLNTIEMSHLDRTFGDVTAKIGPAKVLALATVSSVPSAIRPRVIAAQTYDDYFDEVFAEDKSFSAQSGVTRERIAAAIATYIRTLVPNEAPIDTAPLTGPALNGFHLFNSSGCTVCHGNLAPATMSGLHPQGGFKDAFDTLFTNHLESGNGFPGDPNASGRAQGFVNVKVPTIRNTTLRTRFGHNGFFHSFDSLFDFYNDVSSSGPPTPLQANGAQLSTTQQANVRAFFDALEDPRLTTILASGNLKMPFAHPDLYSDRLDAQVNEPAAFGGHTPSPFFLAPNIIAHIPALSSDPWFKVGVRRATALSVARLVISPNPLPASPSGGHFHLVLNGANVVNTTTNSYGFGTYQNTAPLAALPGDKLSFQWLIYNQHVGKWSYSNAAEIEVQ